MNNCIQCEFLYTNTHAKLACEQMERYGLAFQVDPEKHTCKLFTEKVAPVKPKAGQNCTYCKHFHYYPDTPEGPRCHNPGSGWYDLSTKKIFDQCAAYEEETASSQITPKVKSEKVTPPKKVKKRQNRIGARRVKF